MDNRTVITGVRIPFWNMVELLVQLAVAAIPAMILLSLVAGVLWILALSLLLS